MATNVAYLECTGELWLEVAERLMRESDWQPVYWSGAERMKSDVQRRFQATHFIDNANAVKGQFGTECDTDLFSALDETLLKELAFTESTALHMMDRMDPDGSFNFHERVALYHRHVKYSIFLIEKLKIEIAIFAAPPHLIYDYIFYEVCRIYKIPVVLFTETAVDGLLFSSTSIEEVPQILEKPYQALLAQSATATLSARGQQYWERLQGSYDRAIPDYIAELYRYELTGRKETPSEKSMGSPIDLVRKITGRRKFWQIPDFFSKKPLMPEHSIELDIVNALKKLQQMLSETGRNNNHALAAAIDCTRHLYRAIETEFPIHLKTNALPETFYLKQHTIAPEQSHISHLEYWIYRLLAAKKKQTLLNDYQLLTQPLDLSVPFIYVPLQYQPEVSTSPLGGSYVNQLLLVELLAKSAPTGWSIFVREHPFTFDKKGSGELTRDFDFHRKISSLPNVRLVPLEVPAFDLIDAAKAVATVTGTSGWEAIIRGTPALVFGQAWYKKCEGAFSAADKCDCQNAIRAIEDGYRVNPEKVRKFMQALEQVGFRGYTIPDLSSSAAVSATTNVDSFIAVLNRYRFDSRQAVS
ncbi:MAG TPA: hypothetical protein VGC86_07135 [Afipia sp.]